MTYEEAIENLQYIINDCTETQHDFVEEIEMAIEALEKQIPKKPIEVASPVLKWGLCPACRGELNKLANQPNRVFAFHRFCSDCGQAIDWSDDE